MIDLDKNEQLVAVFRKHPFYITVKIVGMVIVGFLPLVLWPIVTSLLPALGMDGLGYFFAWIYLIYISALWFLGFVVWTDYYLDMWILTDKRLIDVEQRGLFSREISSLRLDRIQDVKIEVVGPLDTFLHIGTVHVQTAGSEKEFVMPSAREPNKVKEAILRGHHAQVETVQTVRLED